ncbi:MAG: hypothetical protein WAK53_16325 [Chromatiaceae bacterium]
MDPEFWHQRWQRGETGWHQAEINAHLIDESPRFRERGLDRLVERVYRLDPGDR